MSGAGQETLCLTARRYKSGVTDPQFSGGELALDDFEEFRVGAAERTHILSLNVPA
jgi:hypothetical protein